MDYGDLLAEAALIDISEDRADMRRQCFPIVGRLALGAAGPAPPIRLADAQAQALAELLPVLGCGEEAAALAFDGLADRRPGLAPARHALRAIAAEERGHDLIIRTLASALPPPRRFAATRIAARRFHVQLGRGGAALHLARIAALDSAVCTALGRLLKPGLPIAADPVSFAALRGIQRDEARHVRVSRELAIAFGADQPMRDAAAQARLALADVLMLAGDAFETLGVDPVVLDRGMRRLPNGLFR